MNGLEALQAMKEGKTVIRYRQADQTPDYSDYYFRLDFKNNRDEMESSKRIWCKSRDEKYWHESENTIKFWLFSDNFAVIETDTSGKVDG
jgi:hypothetical protein